MQEASPNNWHHDFKPAKFLGRVDLNRLISRNEAYRESQVEKATTPCILCHTQAGRGIQLNDRSFLCMPCYNDVSTISYPEKYEKQHRAYLVDVESRRLAWEAFRSQHEPDLQRTEIGVFAWLSLLLLFIHPGFLVLTALLFAVDYHQSEIMKQKAGDWHRLRDAWQNDNPESPSPTLKHFHDPTADLSPRDHQVLRVFNHWPGYPPFWKYLRALVIARDGNRCQVTGCPSRLELHVHHKNAVSAGGAHAPDNLISLCDFHHALEPEKGHERIWGSIKTRYFTLVPTHTRGNRVNDGHHMVRAHLRRLQLITLEELKQLHQTYGFCCPKCNSPQLRFRLFSDGHKIEVECHTCNQSIEGPQQLTEETGPLLGELLAVSRNKGTWKARWDMLDEKKRATWGTWHSPAVKAKRERHRKKSDEIKSAPECPKCGAPMRLITPLANQLWKPFWGCTQFPVTQCRGSRKYKQ